MNQSIIVCVLTAIVVSYNDAPDRHALRNHSNPSILHITDFDAKKYFSAPLNVSFGEDI